MAMFRRVLIANRGEISLRIIRTLRDMGITSVAVFSDADRDARFVQTADEAYRLGPPAAGDSYLNVEALLSVAREARIDAIHPGYGFLAENADFAEAVQKAGITFIGPSPQAIRLMGDKVAARAMARAANVPVVPGSPEPISTADDALELAAHVGYPVAVKAAAGGGGRGIRIIDSPAGMAEALEASRREAQTHFKNSSVYLERYFHDPRHVEIQVLGDHTGHVVHLGERDCSIQRRHQKVIEESPSPAVNRELRARMGETAVSLAKSVDYASAGTVEFLLTSEGEFYFLEMNTRIQVEHPITEAVTGLDLIREMVLAAAGERISVSQDVLDFDGHAFEIRVNAEDPRHGFRPTPTAITRYREPGGIGVRMDSGVYQGYTIPSEYDSLVAKLITWGPDRDTARIRAHRALREFEIDGPATTISLAAAVLHHPRFVAGRAGTSFLDEELANLLAEIPDAAPREVELESPTVRSAERSFEVEVNRRLFRVRVAELEEAPENRPRGRDRSRTSTVVSGNALKSPMHGTVVSLKKEEGDTVEAGETIIVLEAMKMENEVAAHRSGTISALNVRVGDTVEANQELGVID
jgi:acetyl-CoA/propionyl-CoA carboxylase, biotin carboxylase, biotin carboxyl carrier protein